MRSPLGNTLPCKATQRILSALHQYLSQVFTFICFSHTHTHTHAHTLLVPPASLLPPWRVHCAPAFPTVHCTCQMWDFPTIRTDSRVFCGIKSDYCEGWRGLLAHRLLRGCRYWDLQLYLWKSRAFLRYGTFKVHNLKSSTQQEALCNITGCQMFPNLTILHLMLYS